MKYVLTINVIALSGQAMYMHKVFSVPVKNRWK